MSKQSPQSRNKNSLMIINSASNHSEKERQSEDFYATPPRMVRELCEKLDIDFNGQHVWECANGQGHITNELISEYPDVHMHMTDIMQRTENSEVFDFLEVNAHTGNWPESVKPYIDDSGKFHGHIITNPPYFKGTEFLAKACDVLADGYICAFFVKIQYLETLKRYQVFKQYSPYKVLVSVQRVHCGKDGKFDNEEATGGAACYIWYIFKKGYTGPCTLDWINTGEKSTKPLTNPLF